MDLEVHNIYYKGGYIGYAVIDPKVQDISVLIRNMAKKFNCQPENLEVTYKSSNTIHNSIFVRQVFNDHELGDDRSLVI